VKRSDQFYILLHKSFTDFLTIFWRRDDSHVILTNLKETARSGEQFY